MKLNRLNLVTGIVSLSMLGLLSACATTKAPEATTTAAATADNSQPTSPVPAASFVVEAPKPAPAKPAPPPERGSMASVVQKMESSPYTLYWRDNNSYSYYIGGLLDAEYTPGTGLTVQEAKADDTGVTCEFNEQGILSAKNVSASASPAESAVAVKTKSSPDLAGMADEKSMAVMKEMTAGDVQAVKAEPKDNSINDACSELMFTLDDELSD